MNPFSAHPLTLLVILPSLKKESVFHKAVYVCSFHALFDWLCLQAEIYSCDKDDDLALWKAQLPSSVHLHYDPDHLAARHLGCLHGKPVFGKQQSVIHPSLFLLCENKIEASARQIRPSSMERILKKAIGLQCGWLSRNFSGMFDILSNP